MSRVGYIDPNVIMETRNLKVYFVKGGFLAKKQVTKAVDDVDVKIKKGEVLALVGESGSGKTTLGRTMIGLQRITSGQVIYNRDGSPIIIDAKSKVPKHIRRELQMIYQDPYSSIDPYMKVYDALSMPLKYAGFSKKEMQSKIEDSLTMVGLPLDILPNYVFQLSGGQRQRLNIARAISLDPKFLVADEVVTMLDASLKGEIVELFKDINRKTGISMLFITHELPIAKLVAERMLVMYRGKIVEAGSINAVLKDPLHPYTKALIQAYPKISPETKDVIKRIDVKEAEAAQIESKGCPFYHRCPYASERCLHEMPKLKKVASDHEVACYLY
ncbi:MAG: ABC transporter ATP-binding protein [Caldisphaeraceae archaeon]|nr:ABC transporter ATP-binding protein [Caldisphaeraceae archaeon]